MLGRLLKVSAKNFEGKGEGEGEGEGALICWVGALSISREGRFLSYLSNRTKIKRIDNT